MLANEQVIDGHCERCGAEVEAKNLTQWYFKITDYADVLLDEMELLEQWPERVLTMQRNWIGRSEGARVIFRVAGSGEELPVFTTRPDTLFGATFFVLAPEHPLVPQLTDSEEVREYVRHAGARSAVEREKKEKDGVFTGRYAINPVNGEEIPIWVADYVLMGYGTGAIMAVPAHDERDYEFAASTGCRSGRSCSPPTARRPRTARSPPTPRTRCSSTRAGSTACRHRRRRRRSSTWLAERGWAEATIGYRLRDWLLSRQRYWGAPIPIIHCERCGLVPVPDDQLPVVLPEVEEFLPKGRSPLAAAEDWVNVDCPSCGGPARRETDTMDTFVDSSWYFIRYTRSEERQGAVLARDRRLLAAGQPVHRRRRARDPAPALRALLHEGDAGDGPRRLPRAVRAPLQPGDDPQGRREDVQVEGQHRRSRWPSPTATAPTPSGRSRSSWARPTRTWSGTTPGSRASGGS